MLRTIIAILATGGLLAACGDTVGERAVSGAAIGAGAGAAGASITRHDPIDGAVLGGLFGAGVGVLTRPRHDRYDDRYGGDRRRYDDDRHDDGYYRRY